MTIKERDTDVLIIGGGPGGLACARQLAQSGRKTILVERKPAVGRKVCAGGITWSGLLQNIPQHLIEQSFPSQHIITPLQHAVITEKKPIIATVDRLRLGQWMEQEARKAGAEIITGAKARSVTKDAVLVDNKNGTSCSINYRYLVGADGAHSLVRRFLGLPVTKLGLGIQAILPIQSNEMQWHLNPVFFGSGYGWIFPHKKTVSIGCFVKKDSFTSAQLKANLIQWAKTLDIELSEGSITGGLVNYDYRGFAFDNVFLAGEAAGLASGLTGEGIYPAIVTGKLIAHMICDPSYDLSVLNKISKKQNIHHRVLEKAEKSPLGRNLMMELLVVLLRMKCVRFNMLEMAD